MTALMAMGLAGCDERPQPLQIDNTLTAAEIEAGRLTPEVMWKMARAGSSSLSPDGSQLLYAETSYSMEENRGVTVICLEDMATREVRCLTDASSNNVDPKWSADGRTIYFLSDRSGSMQLWRMDAQGGNARQLTRREKDVEGYGVTADGGRLWWVETVHVKEVNSADVHKDMDKSRARIYDDLMVRHWNYWDKGDYRHIFVGELGAAGVDNARDILGADAAWDAPLAPYFDMAEIAWSPDGQTLAYTCKPLTGKAYAISTDSDIFLYDVTSGQTRNICKSAPVTFDGAACDCDEARMVGYDKYPVWSPDGKRIAFRSMERPGYEADKERLFVYDLETGEFDYLTAGFDYNAVNVVWEDDAHLLFIAPIEATQQICRIEVPGRGVRCRTAEVKVLTRGDHDMNAFSIGGGRIVAEMTRLTMATELVSVDPATGDFEIISSINKHIYDHIKFGEVQKRWVKTTDNKQMLTWVVLPPDFDPAKKYPVLLFCEGGPQSIVSQGWSYRWNFQLMVAQGYVVVAPNRRGVPSFGMEWLEQISGDYSGQNIKDYLSAIDDVAREPWADETRMGCVGASYGGYSVYYLAGHHDKRFKAFISHCGIYDFESMYGHTEELFFVNHDYGGSYWDKTNAVAQRSYANSPHKSIDKWDTPILIITGEYDYRIPYTQSLEAFTAARMRGLDARLVSFENEGHQVFKPQNSMVWNREFFGWLDKYLK